MGYGEMWGYILRALAISYMLQLSVNEHIFVLYFNPVQPQIERHLGLKTNRERYLEYFFLFLFKQNICKQRCKYGALYLDSRVNLLVHSCKYSLISNGCLQEKNMILFMSVSLTVVLPRCKQVNDMCMCYMFNIIDPRTSREEEPSTECYWTKPCAG